MIKIITFSLLLISLNANAIVLSGSGITLTTNGNYSHVVSSLKTSDRFEYLYCKDTGQCLQSAVNYNGITEANNPTEGGSQSGKRSSVKSLIKSPITVFKTSQLAYWNPVNKKILSNTWLDTSTTIVDANTLSTEVTFYPDAKYDSAVFEALTAYMPSSFYKSMQYDPATGKNTDKWWFQGEQEFPVIFYTDDEKHAIAHYSKDLPQVMLDGQKLGYGQFKYQAQTDYVSKINCVFRDVEIAATPYSFECKTIVGDLVTVQSTLRKLWQKDHAAGICK